MDNLLSKKIIFLVPSFKFESVSFISYQYVISLRKIGIDASVCSLRPTTILKTLVKQVSKWRIFGCDTLVTNLFLADVVGFLLSRIFLNFKWISFVHCDIVSGLAAENKPFKRLKACIWRYVIDRADLVITPSLYAILRYPLIPKYTVIPHCIEPKLDKIFRAGCGIIEDRSDADVLHKINNPSEIYSYVFIGRDTKGKRLRSLIDLLKSHSNVKLKIFGIIGHSKSALASLTDEQKERCTVFGLNHNPYQYVEAGDIVVCPSGREGFGLVPIECISRGIPVTVFNEGVFKELYGGTTIIYNDSLDLLRKNIQSTADLDAFREKYVGTDALARRVAQLVAVL